MVLERYLNIGHGVISNRGCRILNQTEAEWSLWSKMKLKDRYLLKAQMIDVFVQQIELVLYWYLSAGT